MARTSLLTLLIVSLGLATPRTLADTLTVDDSGGADYTEISEAVTAAQGGDLILVNAGQYESFTVSKRLTILGVEPGVEVGPGSRVTELWPARRVTLADLELADLAVVNCSATVVLDGLAIGDEASPLDQYLAIAGCLDVRVNGLEIPFVIGNHMGMTTSAARVEVVSSSLRGDDQFFQGVPGQSALSAFSASFVHVAATSLQGGRGADGNFFVCGTLGSVPGSHGGDGLFLAGPSELLLAGLPEHLVRGGSGGLGDECACDGIGGSGLQLVSGSRASYSGVTIQGGPNFCSGDSSAILSCGSCLAEEDSPPTPFLIQQLTPSPGSPARFVVYGEPGSAVTLHLGRMPVLHPVVGYELDQLTTRERSFDLGAIGNSGNVSFLLNIPANLPRGFSFYAQADVVGSAGPAHTNSVPVVLR